jgi:hypothetical protein
MTRRQWIVFALLSAAFAAPFLVRDVWFRADFRALPFDFCLVGCLALLGWLMIQHEQKWKHVEILYSAVMGAAFCAIGLAIWREGRHWLAALNLALVAAFTWRIVAELRRLRHPAAERLRAREPQAPGTRGVA